jgi:hypothetical protein
MTARLLAALLLVLLLAEGAAAQQPVRLAAAFGPVTLRAPGVEDFARATSGSVLAEGTALRTGTAGRAVIALPGALAALDQGGHLDVARADGGALILMRGVLAVELREAPATPLQFATPRGVAEIAEPGRYLVAVDAAPAPMQLIAVAGRARLVTGAGPVTVDAGQMAWVPAEGPARLGPAGAVPALLAWLAGEVPPAPIVALAPSPPPAPAQPAAPPAPPPSTTVIVQESYPLYVPVWPVLPPRPRPPLPPQRPPQRPDGPGVFPTPPGTALPGGPGIVTTPNLLRHGR